MANMTLNRRKMMKIYNKTVIALTQLTPLNGSNRNDKNQHNVIE